MNQYNNTGTNPLYLNYDLRTNYLCGVQVKSLRESCKLKAVLNSFECDEAVQEMRRMFIDKGQNDTSNLFTIVKKDWPIKRLPCSSIKEEMSLVIEQVYDEIKRFLATISIESDRSLFVGNFVFNWQGGINPRQTVLRALNRNIFSAREQFEFSCKYLFDEDMILTYFKNLIPHNIDIYFNDNIDDLKLNTFIFYWRIKFSTEYFQNDVSYQEIGFDILLIHNRFFKTPYKLILCTEIAIQYLFHNFNNILVYRDIVHHLIREPETDRINILMYLLCIIRDDKIFTRYAYEILTKLIKNPRWDDTFIWYFSLLRDHVEPSKYLSFIFNVLMEIRVMLKLGLRKYFTLWDEFVQLIPIREINFMKNANEKDYAEKVFHLFTYQDIKLINFFITTDIGKNGNIGDAFYELATTYFDLFAKVYRQCSNNIESFLKEIIKLEDKVSQLSRRLSLRPRIRN